MKTADVRIKFDRDWLALNAYRMALEAIVRAADDRPWEASAEEMAALAASVMREFPGSFSR